MNALITFRVPLEVIECNKKTAMEMRGFSRTKVRQLGFEFFFYLVENITNKKSYELLVQFVMYGNSMFFIF